MHMLSVEIRERSQHRGFFDHFIFGERARFKREASIKSV
jgi:hypothetical protein